MQLSIVQSFPNEVNVYIKLNNGSVLEELGFVHFWSTVISKITLPPIPT